MKENMEPAVPEQAAPPPPSEWFGIWLKAVTRPKVDTYIEIARRADVKTAYIWLAITYLISNMVSLLIIGLNRVAGGYGFFVDSGYGMGGMGPIVANLCCGLPLSVVWGVAMFSGVTALINAIARAIGGVGNYRQLIYCFAACNSFILIIFPATFLLTNILRVSCLIGLIGIATFIYSMVLNVIAIKAVHQIDIVSSVVVIALMVLIASCVATGIFTLIRRFFSWD